MRTLFLTSLLLIVLSFTLFEQLLGEKGMKKMLMVTGAGLTAGGAIAAIIYIVRMEQIKSVINEFYSMTYPFKVNPALIINRDLNIVYPGITLTCNF